MSPTVLFTLPIPPWRIEILLLFLLFCRREINLAPPIIPSNAVANPSTAIISSVEIVICIYYNDKVAKLTAMRLPVSELVSITVT